MGDEDCQKIDSSSSSKSQEQEEIKIESSSPSVTHHHEIHHDPAIIRALEGDFHKLGLYQHRQEQESNGTVNYQKDASFSNKNGNFIMQYPLRPEEPDCSFYLRTGACRYGLNCRFNHPHNRNKEHVRFQQTHFPESLKVVKEKDNKEEYPERPGEPECKYYLKTGVCKYGKDCRYDHPQEKTAVGPAQQFNFLGLPIRPGEKECPFYMRVGSCKFATNCRFHHPDPGDALGLDPSSGYHNGASVPLQSAGASQSSASWSSPRTSNDHVPYASQSYSGLMVAPSQGTQQNLEWNGYQGPVYPPKGNINSASATFKNNSIRKTDGSKHYRHQQQMTTDEFPERPGERECQYFMRNGDCKYRSACRFDHPKNRLQNSPALSPLGLPLRPGEEICSHYSHYGICKFGPACKFDHPLNYDGSSAAAPTMSTSDQLTHFDDAASSGSSRRTGYENGNEAVIQQSL
ncbi:hypothetical protein MKW94_006985 [Papaver nudicaule]|uniref:C3H1-type domain-containing protein n=1 Tax=Papaver nudicaule TaxID=74823 RepID=A0AA41VJB7_PAPNU|nr:hypothetical protein [Papaver nudicaule]